VQNKQFIITQKNAKVTSNNDYATFVKTKLCILTYLESSKNKGLFMILNSLDPTIYKDYHTTQ